MKLFLVETTGTVGYDDYDGIVVAAKDTEKAAIMACDYCHNFKISKISIDFLGETDKPEGVILASFNAG